MPRKKVSKVRLFFAALALMLGLGAVTAISAAPAGAANGTYLSYSRGTSVWYAQTMGSNASGTFVANGRSFDELCWKDGPTTSFHGNYATNRYFYGRAWTSVGPIYGWVTASVVINQSPVGNCGG